MSEERISELVDGELSDDHLPLAFSSLNGEDGQNTWDLYHQIGDILRSDDMAISLSPQFASSFSARLEAEPTVLAPKVGAVQMGEQQSSIAASGGSQAPKRFSMQGLAVAVTITVFAVMSVPQLMVAMKGTVPQNGNAPIAVAAVHSASPVITAQEEEGTVLRDPQIDQYLLAHQRFSPSAYSIAQYARPATFAADSNK